MKITEIAIIGVVPFYFRKRRIGSVEARTCAGRNDCLGIRLECGVFLQLPAAMDISERSLMPRIFVVEGKPNEAFAIFGGGRIYWISTAGEVEKDFQTFRTYAAAEYWETKIIERPSDAVLVYEAGVSVIDEDLRIRCHKAKYFNDFFVAIEGDSIMLLRDHTVEWRIRLVEEDDSKPRSVQELLQHAHGRAEARAWVCLCSSLTRTGRARTYGAAGRNSCCFRNRIIFPLRPLRPFALKARRRSKKEKNNGPHEPIEPERTTLDEGEADARGRSSKAHLC